MKIDLSNPGNTTSVEIQFANGMVLTVDQTTGKGKGGIVVRVSDGEYHDLNDLQQFDRKFYNPNNHKGFLLIGKS